MNRLLCLLALALLAPVSPARASSRPGMLVDSYAAVVNGRVITLGDVLAALQPVQDRLALQYDGPELEKRVLEAYNSIRDSLVESELILLDFEIQGGTLPDRAIEDHINSVIHDRFGNDRAEFLRALAAERLTFAEWRQQMKEQLIVQIMRQREVTSKILITPLDLEQAYVRNLDRYALPERVRLHTLSLGPAGAGPDRDAALARAESLRQSVLAGDAQLDASAGTLLMDGADWIDPSSLQPAIREALSPLSPGGIAPPVEISGDLYLVQLVEHQPARQRTLDEVIPEIEKELRRSESERISRIWLDSLRSKYFIQLFSHNLFD